MLGRNAELDIIRRRIQQAVEGQHRILALRGESGIGKTHLLHAALSEADKFGLATRFIGCRGSQNAQVIEEQLAEQLADAPDLLLVAVDDLDEASETLHERLAEETHAALMLITHTQEIHFPTEESLTLHPLTTPDRISLAAAWGSPEPDPHRIALSEGNPLWLRLLLDNPQASSVEAALRARLRAFSSVAHAVVAGVAVLGDGTPRDILIALDLLNNHDHDTLHQLHQAGWLEPISDGGYRFINRLPREVVQAALPPLLQAEIHEGAGDYIITQGGDVEQAIAHYRLANRPDLALQAVEHAISQLRTGTLPRELLQHAIDVTGDAHGLAAKRADYVEQLGDGLVREEDYSGAAEVYSTLELDARTLAIHGKYGLALLPSDPQTAVEVLTALMPRVPVTDDLRWRLEAGLAWGIALTGQHYQAVRRSRDALVTLNTLHGYGEARTLLRAVLGMALYYQGDVPAAEGHLAAAESSWAARGVQQGPDLIRTVRVGAPTVEATSALLTLCLTPLLR